MSEQWQDEWQPVIDAIGRQFGSDEIVLGADRVEAGSVRRYVEPLEFGSPLHHDAEAARAAGYPDIIAPYTSILSYSVPAMWHGGEDPLFDSDERDAQPARSPINNEDLGIGPKTTGFFATDMSLEFVRPIHVGERVGRRGNRLVGCSPKETSVGRGAFLVWESELVTEDGEVVASMRTGTFAYVPHEKTGPTMETA
jgi:hypothetical protein